MDDKGLLGAIAHVNSIWSIAAFAIAAVIAVLRIVARLADRCANAAEKQRPPR